MDTLQLGPDLKTDIRIARRTFRKIGLFFFLFSALAIEMQLFFCVFLKTFFPGVLASTAGILIFLILVPMYVISFPVTFALFSTIPATKRAPAVLRMNHFFCFLLMCYPIIFVGSLIGQIFQFLAKYFGFNVDISLQLSISGQTLYDLVTGSSIYLDILVVCILAPIFEELLFRKVLIDRIGQYGDKVAIITSGLLFGLFHGNFLQFFYAAMLGMLFAYIYCKTGRVRYTIALHMIVNFSSVLVSKLYSYSLRLQSEHLNHFSLSFFMLLFICIFVVVGLTVLIIGIVFLCKYLRRFQFDKGQTPLPRGTAFRVIWLNIGMILFLLSCAFMFLSSSM